MWRLKVGLIMLLGMSVIAGISIVRYGRGEVEQDHYLEYAAALRRGELARLSRDDRRLMPGLPWLLTQGGVVGGYVVTGVSVILAGYLLVRMTGEKSAIMGILFPPVMLAAGSVVGTEMLTVALVLLAIYWFEQKRYFAAATIIGLGLSIRLIFVAVGVVMVVYLLYTKKYKEILFYIWIGLWSGIFLGGWNWFTWGEGAIQLTEYARYGRASVGIFQLIQDVPRAIDWGWYRQVVSGLGYLGFLGYLLVVSRDKGRVVGWVAMAMVGFVFILGPTPFLEEFPRFLVPVWPLLYIMTYRMWRGWWVWTLPLVSAIVVLV